MKKKIFVLLPPKQFGAFCDDTRLSKLRRDFDLYFPSNWDQDAWECDRLLLESAEIIATGWRAKPLPAWYEGTALELMLVAAGDTSPYEAHCPPSARLVGAGPALGFGVAEYCLSMLINAAKRIHWLANATREQGAWRTEDIGFGPWFELYGNTVGIIGFGHSGRALARLLRPFDCDIVVYDPFVSAHEIVSTGAKALHDLTEMFESCRAVCLLAGLTKNSRGLLGADHFSRLAHGSVFINAARAALIREDELIMELKTNRFVAVIDVTDQEPPPLDHPFRRLPNVILSPHIAGAVADNRRRMGDYLIDALYSHRDSLIPMTFQG